MHWLGSKVVILILFEFSVPLDAWSGRSEDSSDLVHLRYCWRHGSSERKAQLSGKGPGSCLSAELCLNWAVEMASPARLACFAVSGHIAACRLRWL